ncbi:MAG: proline dehydrogenase family protein [Candidatus Zixiibacteriota bacterium]|nr:MAG: proline dehydrogenase family protein [candidate division Zixibacteria bacterium]
MGLLTFLARRFIAGETKEDAVRAVRDLNALGMKTSLDILGENVTSEALARDLADKYIEVLETINHENIKANVSVKLTQMGLDISDDFCFDNVSRIIEAARGRGNFVRIDMEGSDYTQRTLDLVYRWAEKYDNVGTVIQSMLYRSADDIAELIRRGIRVRLCKGAYKEPASVAFQKKEQVNENFIKLMKMLLDSGQFHSVATHDNVMIEATKKYSDEKGISKDRYEFQMLFGINRSGQVKLVREGYGMLVYVPFGTHWFPYYYRRLRERKENILFILKHLFKG